MNNTYEKNFASRLDYAMKLRGKKAVDICNATGLSSALVSQYLSGKFEPKNDKVVVLGKFLSVSPSWLLCFDDDMMGTSNIASIDDSMVNPRKKYFGNVAKGDSMTGAGINDGDILIFEVDNAPEDGQIGSFCIDED